MIARNFIRHPDALIAQHELELVPAVAAEVSPRELDLVRASFAASGAWLRQYACAAAGVARKVPAWFAAMRRRALALAKAVKEACAGLFETFF